MEKIRIEYIDSLKGFLIICVLTSHVIQLIIPNCMNDYLYKFVISFQMPLFMFVCGFVSFAPIITYGSVKKRFLQLMIPWFFWGAVINPIIYADFNINRYVNLFFYPPFWFLWALFFISLFFYFFNLIANKYNIKQEIIILLGYFTLAGIYIGAHFELFHYGLISYHFLFYSIGFFFRKYWKNIQKYLKYCFLICFPIFAILFFYIKEEAPLIIFNYTIDRNLLVWIYRIVTAIVSIPVFLYIFKQYGEKVPYLNIIGKNTMGIYLIHGMLLLLIPLFPIVSNNFYYLAVFLFVFLFILVSNIIINLLRKGRILRFLMLGEKYKS